MKEGSTRSESEESPLRCPLQGSPKDHISYRLLLILLLVFDSVPSGLPARQASLVVIGNSIREAEDGQWSNHGVTARQPSTLSRAV